MSNIELEQAIVLYNIKEFKKAEIILQEIFFFIQDINILMMQVNTQKQIKF